MRQARRRTVTNRAQRSALRTAMKRVRGAANKQEATQAYTVAVTLLDRAARKGLIHKKMQENVDRLQAAMKTRMEQAVKG